jgi:aminopeptidase N
MVKDDSRIQIDLYAFWTIDRILLGRTPLKYTRETNAVFIDFPQTLTAGRTYDIDFYYSGMPEPSARFGCITFQKDTAGRPWITTACEDAGASYWWPNKDQWRDEVENMQISVAVPNNLVDVSNGALAARPISVTATRAGTGLSPTQSTTTASRSISPHTKHFSDRYGDLPLDYYVLPEDVDKAKEQFSQVKPMLPGLRALLR